MMHLRYASKKVLKANVGKELRFMETSIFGTEYPENGTGTIVGAYRPHLQPLTVTNKNGKVSKAREFFAKVTLVNHIITKVE